MTWRSKKALWGGVAAAALGALLAAKCAGVWREKRVESEAQDAVIKAHQTVSDLTDAAARMLEQGHAEALRKGVRKAWCDELVARGESVAEMIAQIGPKVQDVATRQDLLVVFQRATGKNVGATLEREMSEPEVQAGMSLVASWELRRATTRASGE